VGTGARGIRKLLEQTSTRHLQDALFFAIRISHWVQKYPDNVEFAADMFVGGCQGAGISKCPCSDLTRLIRFCG
jgi:hypothetical protein